MCDLNVKLGFFLADFKYFWYPAAVIKEKAWIHSDCCPCYPPWHFQLRLDEWLLRNGEQMNWWLCVVVVVVVLFRFFVLFSFKILWIPVNAWQHWSRSPLSLHEWTQGKQRNCNSAHISMPSMVFWVKLSWVVDTPKQKLQGSMIKAQSRIGWYLCINDKETIEKSPLTRQCSNLWARLSPNPSNFNDRSVSMCLTSMT